MYATYFLINHLKIGLYEKSIEYGFTLYHFFISLIIPYILEGANFIVFLEYWKITNTQAESQ